MRSTAVDRLAYARTRAGKDVGPVLLWIREANASHRLT